MYSIACVDPRRPLPAEAARHLGPVGRGAPCDLPAEEGKYTHALTDPLIFPYQRLQLSCARSLPRSTARLSRRGKHSHSNPYTPSCPDPRPSSLLTYTQSVPQLSARSDLKSVVMHSMKIAHVRSSFPVCKCQSTPNSYPTHSPPRHQARRRLCVGVAHRIGSPFSVCVCSQPLAPASPASTTAPTPPRGRASVRLSSPSPSPPASASSRPMTSHWVRAVFLISYRASDYSPRFSALAICSRSLRIRKEIPRIHGRYAQLNARPQRPCTLPSLCSHLLLPFYTDNLSEKGVHE